MRIRCTICMKSFGRLLASLVICLFGFHRILSGWWEAGYANVKQWNKRRHSLLRLAALGGSFAVAEALLERGADVNAQGGKCGSALKTALLRRNACSLLSLIYWHLASL